MLFLIVLQKVITKFAVKVNSLEISTSDLLGVLYLKI